MVGVGFGFGAGALAGWDGTGGKGDWQPKQCVDFAALFKS
ncbi:MAG: hypothetical protein JWP29_5554 [Rhodoferax sp.]|nr:hypothetical protein [Rhodoferax sp.]